MSSEKKVPPGLYDLLVTRQLAESLESLARQHELEVAELDPGLAPESYARALGAAALKALRSFRQGTHEERRQQQVEWVNGVLQAMDRLAPGASLLPEDAVDPPGRSLLSVTPSAPQGLVRPEAPARPHIPLTASDLLVNGPHDLRIGAAVRREFASADRVDLLLSFLKFKGVALLEDEIRAFLERRPGQLRVLTTSYLGATEPRALELLATHGARIRVSYDKRRTRLHAKAWLFHRESGFSTAYIGSSNLSVPAMLDGLEWNVRVSEVDNHAVLSKFRGTFEQYWESPDFSEYEAEAFEEAVARERSDTALIAKIRIRPFPHQAEILDILEEERSGGRNRNLVVAATGTGKTILVALDYQRLCQAEGRKLKLLFVAHRKEILEQARHQFRVVLQDGTFGEVLGDGRRPSRGDHVFALIQTLHREQEYAADFYDYVVVDEFHHAPAATYRQFLEFVEPRYLLGLTATPERTDGQSVLEWFGGRIAAELRLWSALDRGLLAPFQYFGVSDGCDLSGLRWSRGGYDLGQLSELYTGNDARFLIVLRALREKVPDLGRFRGLGFCVSVAHAQFMALRFTEAGIPAVALHGGSERDERADAQRKLAAREIHLIFTVDLYNEGVDIPSVDTVLFLRPTESATLFLQQLGRGLRLAPDKDSLTVLDFVGEAHRSFQFEARFRSLIGGTRRGVVKAVEEGFPFLPAGCSIQLDRQAQEVVLDNIRRSLRVTRRSLVQDLRGLGADIGLKTFLEETGIELEDLYRGGRTWSDLRRAAGLPCPDPGPDEARFSKALARLLHLDDPERLESWLLWLWEEAPPRLEAVHTRAGRLQRMLFAALGQIRRPVDEIGRAFAEFWAHAALRSELAELLELLDDRRRKRTFPSASEALPLRIHATYSLDEIVAGYGIERNGVLYRPRGQGVFYDEASNTDLLFVTLVKPETDYSPTTLYEDYVLSPTEFHWESQNSTHPRSSVGRRYLDGTSQVVLFVRDRAKDDRNETVPYLNLGSARLESWESERPIRIVWKLAHPMPGSWYEEMKLAAG